MLQRVSAHDADEVPAAADAAARDGPTPQTLEQFLGGVGPRAFRFADMGLRQREDALDAVQDAMLKMLGYRDRPAAAWPPLLWRLDRKSGGEGKVESQCRSRWGPTH